MALANDIVVARRVALACQGGASHTAFTAGALKQIFADYAAQEAEGQPAVDRYRIIGLSGTSGGAICAFLAWYGLITGGPRRAIELLDAFWTQRIAANTFLEEVVLQTGGLAVLRTPMGRILQTMAQLMGAPYIFNPQTVMDVWSTWHLGPLADFIAPRPEHVNMEALFNQLDPQGQSLVEPLHVAHIVAVQRELQQISKIISELNVLPAKAKAVDVRLQQAQELARKVSLEVEVGIITPELRAAIRRQLHALLAASVDGGAPKLEELTFVQPLPALLLGAVDVLSGAFKAFDSRKGEVSIEAVLASTILPDLFQARRIGNEVFWDGLFSQNPPIRGFVELPDEPGEKPDEIWLIKIDPRERLQIPNEPGEIDDRRNELSGDLSLNQELSVIESMNRWLGKLNAASSRKYKHISILRMQLEERAVQDTAFGILDVPSKFFRGQAFMRRLMEHGQEQARAFLPLARQKARLRRFVDQGWNRLMDGTLQEVKTAAVFARSHVLTSFSGATANRDCARLTGPDEVQSFIAELQAACLNDPAFAQASDARKCAVTIDDLIVEARGDPAHPREFFAVCRWTLRATEPDAVRVPGSSPAPRPAAVKIQGTWVSRVVDDQILESWVWDTRGLVPAPRPIVTPEPAADARRHETGKVVHTWVKEGWAKGKLGLMDECFATSYVHNDCGYFPDVCGLSDYKEWQKRCTPRPDLVLLDLFAEGDRQAALLAWGDGQRGVAIYRVVAGAIQESWWTWDTQLLCAASGVASDRLPA